MFIKENVSFDLYLRRGLLWLLIGFLSYYFKMVINDCIYLVVAMVFS